jgi:hypothetical protein
MILNISDTYQIPRRYGDAQAGTGEVDRLKSQEVDKPGVELLHLCAYLAINPGKRDKGRGKRE